MRQEATVLGAGLSEEDLDATRSLILQAYFGLHRTRPGECIGTREIQDWIVAHEPDVEDVPSAATIQRTLVAAGLTHRGRGKPRNDSRGDPVEQTAPFLPVRRQAPRVGGRK